MRRHNRAYLAVLLSVSLLASISGYTVGTHRDTVTYPTPAPAQPHSIIYMAHCDTSGHYQLVQTDSLAVAEDQARLGFWPIPVDYYQQLKSDIASLTCVPGPMDKGSN